MINITEYLIPYSPLIEGIGVGDMVRPIPEEGLPLDTDDLQVDESWRIILKEGGSISMERRYGGVYIYVPNKKIVGHTGFTRLLKTDRGPKGATEYAVVEPGFHYDGSSDRAAICVSGEEVLVYPGRPASA